ncbi:MAG: hypothetical protein Q9211_002162 [Gyalolechia sp. 1 TL-2023]
MAPPPSLPPSLPHHQDTDGSGLVEALDREAARMHAANYLARAREELVQNMQASRLAKQVPPGQGAEVGNGIPSLPAPAPAPVLPQPRPRPQIPAQVQAQWRGQEMQGLGIAMGESAAGANGRESRADDEQAGPERREEEQRRRRRAQGQAQQHLQGDKIVGSGEQDWERQDRTWGEGPLGSMGGIEVAREGMTGLVDRNADIGEEGKGKERENGKGSGS